VTYVGLGLTAELTGPTWSLPIILAYSRNAGMLDTGEVRCPCFATHCHYKLLRHRVGRKTYTWPHDSGTFMLIYVHLWTFYYDNLLSSCAVVHCTIITLAACLCTRSLARFRCTWFY